MSVLWISDDDSLLWFLYHLAAMVLIVLKNLDHWSSPLVLSSRLSSRRFYGLRTVLYYWLPAVDKFSKSDLTELLNFWSFHNAKGDDRLDTYLGTDS